MDPPNNWTKELHEKCDLSLKMHQKFCLVRE